MRCSKNEGGGIVMELGKRLFRSRRMRSIAGVCGGMAEQFNINLTLIRVILLVAALPLFYFTGIFAYLIAMLTIPLEPEVN